MCEPKMILVYVCCLFNDMVSNIVPNMPALLIRWSFLHYLQF